VTEHEQSPFNTRTEENSEMLSHLTSQLKECEKEMIELIQEGCKISEMRLPKVQKKIRYEFCCHQKYLQDFLIFFRMFS